MALAPPLLLEVELELKVVLVLVLVLEALEVPLLATKELQIVFAAFSRPGIG